MSDPKHPTALLSYSHDSPEHEHRVLELCNRLRERGVDTFVDRFLAGAPAEGWPLWMERQIESRDFTLMICTQTYRRRFMEAEPSDAGRGVVWEARILRNLLYENPDQHGRIVPVVFSAEDRTHVPTVFRGHFYDVGDERGFEGLVRHLLREPGAEARALGPLGPQGSRWSAFERPWLVPDAMRTRFFTGRDALLARIERQLAESHRAALSGLGGVGKSQTAIEYAVRHRDDYPDGVFWVNAETPTALTSGFVDIARTLSLTKADSSDQEQAARSALEWLDSTNRWLLVLDNVDERRAVTPFVPQRGRGDLLITSRESVFQDLGIPRGIDVGDFDRDEAVRFMLARAARGDGESDAARELAAELGRLPLALEQAAAYIVETNATLSDYLSSYRKRRMALLEKASGLVARDTVAVTWAANFEAVSRASPAAADLMRVSAFLSPDAIPFEVFEKGAAALGEPIAGVLDDPDDALAMNELLRPLTRYSLVRSDPQSRSLGVHRLVQEIVRAAIPRDGRAAVAGRATAALEAAFPDVGYSTFALCDRLISHVFAAFASDDPPMAGETAARLFHKVGDYLNQRGRYDESEALQRRALELAERSLGADHLEVAAILGGLADVLEHRSRYPESEALYTRSLAIRERRLGSDHPLIGLSLNGIANSYAYQGRYDEAKGLYERAIAVLEGFPGAYDDKRSVGLHNLANTLVFLGRYAEAKPLFEEALELAQRTFGPDAPKTALCVYGLADATLGLGDADGARPLFARALAAWENALGPDHQYVAFALEGLAKADALSKDYAGAEALYRRALQIRERALGKEHPQFAGCLTSLADLYVEQGRYDEARPLLENACAIRERVLGAEHPEFATSLAGLAALYARLGSDADAIELYDRALRIKTRAQHDAHPEVVAIRTALEGLRTKTLQRPAAGA